MPALAPALVACVALGLLNLLATLARVVSAYAKSSLVAKLAGGMGPAAAGLGAGGGGGGGGGGSGGGSPSPPPPRHAAVVDFVAPGVGLRAAAEAQHMASSRRSGALSFADANGSYTASSESSETGAAELPLASVPGGAGSAGLLPAPVLAALRRKVEHSVASGAGGFSEEDVAQAAEVLALLQRMIGAPSSGSSAAAGGRGARADADADDRAAVGAGDGTCRARASTAGTVGALDARPAAATTATRGARAGSGDAAPPAPAAVPSALGSIWGIWGLQPTDAGARIQRVLQTLQATADDSDNAGSGGSSLRHAAASDAQSIAHDGSSDAAVSADGGDVLALLTSVDTRLGAGAAAAAAAHDDARSDRSVRVAAAAARSTGSGWTSVAATGAREVTPATRGVGVGRRAAGTEDPARGE
jgi:hypothetical protein